MTPRPTLPLDRVMAVYNAILALVWWSLADRDGAAPFIAAAHSTAVTLPWLLARSRGRLSRPTRMLVELHPLLWLSAFWSELGLLQSLRQLPAHDAWVAGLDRAIFGASPHLAWRSALPQPWLAELMFLAYFAYYLMIFGPPLALIIAGRRNATRDLLLRVMTTYLVCFLVYLVFPVYGPKFTPEVRALHWPQGLFARLVHEAHAAGDSPGTAFPSSHCAAVVAMAWFAWRWFRPRAAVLMSLLAAAVIVSTIYTQNHFAIDALSGVGVAVAVQALLLPGLRRAFEARSTVGPVPLFPSFEGRAFGPGAPGGES